MAHPFRLLIAALPVLALSGCGDKPAAVPVVEKRDGAKTGPEELVRRYIVRNAPEKAPFPVRFVAWGPHMAWKEIQTMLREGGVNPAEIPESKRFDWIVRVRYVLPEEKTEFGKAPVKPKPAPAPAPRAGADNLPPPVQQSPDKVDEFNMKTVWVKTAKDALFLVRGKLVYPCPCPWPEEVAGDSWKTRYRKEFGKAFPAFNP